MWGEMGTEEGGGRMGNGLLRAWQFEVLCGWMVSFLPQEHLLQYTVLC